MVVLVGVGGEVVARRAKREAELERGGHPSTELMVFEEGAPVLALALLLRQGKNNSRL